MRNFIIIIKMGRYMKRYIKILLVFLVSTRGSQAREHSSSSHAVNCQRFRQLVAISSRDEMTRKQMEAATDVMSRAVVFMLQSHNNIDAAYLRALNTQLLTEQNMADILMILGVCGADTRAMSQAWRSINEFLKNALDVHDVSVVQLLYDADLLRTYLLFDAINREGKPQRFVELTLSYAIEKRVPLSIINLFLKDPQLKKEDLNKNDNDFSIPLLRAIVYNRADVVGALLQDPRINVNIKGKISGTTALREAIQSRNPAFLSLLLAHPLIDVNLRMGRNEYITPLMFAVIRGNCDAVQQLLNHSSIDVDIINTSHENALDLVQKSPHRFKMMNLFEDYYQHRHMTERMNALLIRERGKVLKQ